MRYGCLLGVAGFGFQAMVLRVKQTSCAMQWRVAQLHVTDVILP